MMFDAYQLLAFGVSKCYHCKTLDFTLPYRYDGWSVEGYANSWSWFDILLRFSYTNSFQFNIYDCYKWWNQRSIELSDTVASGTMTLHSTSFQPTYPCCEFQSPIIRIACQQLGNSRQFKFGESNDEMSQSSTILYLTASENNLDNNCAARRAEPRVIFLAVDDSPLNLIL